MIFREKISRIFKLTSFFFLLNFLVSIFIKQHSDLKLETFSLNDFINFTNAGFEKVTIHCKEYIREGLKKNNGIFQ